MRGKTFYPLETVQTGPGAHTVSYSVGSAVSLDIKQSRLKAGHSPPSSAEAENDRIYTSIHPYVFMACTLCFFTFTDVEV